MASELMKIAEGFSLVAEGIREFAKEQNDTNVVKVKKTKKQSDATLKQIAEETISVADQPEDQEQEISIEDIRAVLADKSQDGKIKEVRALLKQFGVAKLSNVEEKDYLELLQKAKEL